MSFDDDPDLALTEEQLERFTAVSAADIVFGTLAQHAAVALGDGREAPAFTAWRLAQQGIGALEAARALLGDALVETGELGKTLEREIAGLGPTVLETDPWILDKPPGALLDRATGRGGLRSPESASAGPGDRDHATPTANVTRLADARRLRAERADRPERPR